MMSSQDPGFNRVFPQTEQWFVDGSKSQDQAHPQIDKGELNITVDGFLYSTVGRLRGQGSRQRLSVFLYFEVWM